MMENTENILFVFFLLLFIFCITAMLDKAVIVRCAIYMLFSLFIHNVVLKYHAVPPASISSLCNDLHMCIHQIIHVVDFICTRW
jgi:hypothetical protein